MTENKLPKYLLWIFVILTACFSCVDESFESARGEGTYITITGLASQTTRVDPVPGGDIDGIGLDNVVTTLRVLVFDENDNGNIVPDSKIGNAKYNIVNT